jgi:tetratricopeptide (TPR) repeat protein
MPLTTSSEKARERYLRGRTDLEASRLEQAREHFTWAVREDPEFAVAYLGLARAAATEADFHDALHRAVALVDRVTRGERNLILAFRAEANGNLDGQFRQIKWLANGYPEDPQAQVLLAGAYFGRNNPSHATRCYERAIELDPTLAPAYEGLARVHFSLEQFKQAEEALATLTQLAPELEVSHHLLGELQMKLGRFEQSIASYQKALALDPGDVTAQIAIGNNLLFMERANDAREQFRQLHDRANDDDQRRRALVWIAAVHLHEESPDEALQALRQAATVAERGGDARALAEVLEMMGNVLLESGSVEQAHARFKESAAAIERTNFPGPVKMAERINLVYQEARIALAREDLAAAKERITFYRRALGKQRIPEAKHRFTELGARLGLAAGDYSAAEESLERADLDDPRIVLLSAEIYHAMGRPDEARDFYDKAANFNEARLELALVRPKARRLLAEL